jgi:hypothetical protein
MRRKDLAEGAVHARNFSSSPAPLRAFAAVLTAMAALVVASLLLAGCGGSGGGGDGVLDDDDPLDIAGQYAVRVEPTGNTCGIPIQASDTTMRVQEDGESAATVDIPLEADCNPQLYERDVNTLTRSGLDERAIDLGCAGGDCIVEIDSSTRLEFGKGGGVTGEQTNEVAAAGGDCSCVSALPCTIELALDGDECSGCFECTSAARAGSAPADPRSLLDALEVPVRREGEP